MSDTTELHDPSRSILCAVLDDGQIAVARVIGRGNFGNAMPFKRFATHVAESPAERQKFIVDLHECETMDSTFMGVLAGVCIAQNQKGEKKGRVIVVNANDHCRRLLRNLGLTHLLEVKDLDMAALEQAAELLVPADGSEATKLEQICLTLQAHKNLIKVDGQNEVRFQAVIEYLEKALVEEKQSSSS